MLGGSERQGYLLSKALSAAGLRPGVVVWTADSEDIFQDYLREIGVPVIYAPQDAGWQCKIRWLRRLMLDVRPSILQSMAFYLNATAAWAMRGVEGVAVGAIRGAYEFESRYGRVYYAVNRFWPRFHVANSGTAANAARRDRAILKPRDVYFVPNGIDLALYSERCHKRQPCPRILGVGNLLPEKSWDRLIRASGTIRRSHPDLDFSVRVVGEGRDRTRLEDMVASEGLTDRFHFMGRRHDVPALLTESDVFALVSEYEGCPNAAMEAMASALPVIATDSGDLPRLVRDGVDGFVVPRENGNLLAERLHALITDHELRAVLGGNGRRRAEAEFGLENLAKNILAAYRGAGLDGR